MKADDLPAALRTEGHVSPGFEAVRDAFTDAGGAMGFADPKSGIGYRYVTSQGGTSVSGDPRDVALRSAVYSVI